MYHVAEVQHVTVKVDDVYLGQASRHGDSAFYTVPWQPSGYATGIHTLSVTVKVTSGLSTSRCLLGFFDAFLG